MRLEQLTASAEMRDLPEENEEVLQSDSPLMMESSALTWKGYSELVPVCWMQAGTIPAGLPSTRDWTPERTDVANRVTQSWARVAKIAFGFSATCSTTGTSNGVVSFLAMDGSSMIFPPVGAGDFNNDRKDDVVWRNRSNGQSKVWLMGGGDVSVGWPAPFATGVPPEWKITAVGDYSGDNYPDVVWTNVNTGQSKVWVLSSPSLSTAWPPVFYTTAPGGWNIVGP